MAKQRMAKQRMVKQRMVKQRMVIIMYLSGRRSIGTMAYWAKKKDRSQVFFGVLLVRQFHC
jgi:hypothetical protein